MRDQYAGDVSDLLKFSFLRALAQTDRRLGVAWYYIAEGDGGPDGQHTEWKYEEHWRNLDADLFLKLSSLSARSVAVLESSSVCPPGTIFHGEPVPDRFARASWCDRKNAALEGADIVFLDPDNGLGDSGKKHATYSELLRLRGSGRPIAFITFPGRQFTHDVMVSNLHHQLKSMCGVGSVITLRTSVSVPRAPGSPYVVQRQRWFTVTDPDEVLVERAARFAEDLSRLRRAKAVLDVSR